MAMMGAHPPRASAPPQMPSNIFYILLRTLKIAIDGGHSLPQRRIYPKFLPLVQNVLPGHEAPRGEQFPAVGRVENLGGDDPHAIFLPCRRIFPYINEINLQTFRLTGFQFIQAAAPSASGMHLSAPKSTRRGNFSCINRRRRHGNTGRRRDCRRYAGGPAAAVEGVPAPRRRAFAGFMITIAAAAAITTAMMTIFLRFSCSQHPPKLRRSPPCPLDLAVHHQGRGAHHAEWRFP